MKKTLVILALSMVLLLSGCAPFVLNMADSAGLIDVEPLHIRSAKPIPEPVFETCCPIDQKHINDIFSLTNQERQALGISELSLSPTLCEIAELRAVDMAEKNYLNRMIRKKQSSF